MGPFRGDYYERRAPHKDSSGLLSTTNQEMGPHQALNLLAPWFWTSELPELWKIRPSLSFFLSAALGFEPSTVCLQSRCTNTWTTPPMLFCDYFSPKMSASWVVIIIGHKPPMSRRFSFFRSIYPKITSCTLCSQLKSRLKYLK